MINVGIIGLGMMGSTHLEVYARHPDARVLAVADANADRLHGKTQAQGNIEGQAQGGSALADVPNKYADAQMLIDDPQVELVDLCLPTPLHRRFAEAALKAGKHLLIEKPLARTAADAAAIAAAGAAASGLSMPAMCMRFWPGWDWLKQAVAEKRYGKVLAANFRRVASHPGGPFYSDGKAAGGAILDLHIHDTDFVQYLFGTPKAVFTRGYSKPSSEPDHVLTHYVYDDVPLVTAEGGWAMTEGFGFSMQYTINFERATAVFDIGAEQKLHVTEEGKERQNIELRSGMGYDYEIAYMLDCIAQKRKPTTVTLADAAESVRIVEAERQSMMTGEVVSC